MGRMKRLLADVGSRGAKMVIEYERRQLQSQ